MLPYGIRMKTVAGVRATCMLILVLRMSDAVDYDDWDDSVPADVLSQPAGIVGVLEEKGPKLWPNKTGIPYMIDTIFSQVQQIRIQQALRKVERSTGGCVMFKKRTDEKDYVLFKWSYSTCGTIPGMQGGEQLVHLSDECTDLGRVQHEVMHVLGFYHEQSRPDRADYIQLRYDNIPDGEMKQFQIEPLAHTFGTKYDYNSITHYGAFAFSSSNGPTSIPKKGLMIRMGRYARLSPGDIAKIKIGYKCQLRVRPTSAVHVANLIEPFPIFSLEPMTYSQCKLQFNDYCASTFTTRISCETSRALLVKCLDTTTEPILREMSTGMAEGPMRAVMINAHEMTLATYSFIPLRRQVIALKIRNCTTNRVTGRLIPLNFTNLLDFGVLGCSELVVMKEDFVTCRKLRMIMFSGSTITMLQTNTFADLPDLQVISLEGIWNNEQNEYNRFDGPMQTYLYNLHCSCEFAWYRSWWRSNKNLKLKVEDGEVYSIAGAFEHFAYAKEELYHPIDCTVSPFPLGTEWVNYHTQTEYSINDPNCEKFQRCRGVLQALSSDCI